MMIKNMVDVNSLKPNQFDKITSANVKDKDLKDVCNQFESFFINQLLNISLKDTKVAGEGVGSDIVKSMYLENISQQSSGGFGMSEILYKFLSENKR